MKQALKLIGIVLVLWSSSFKGNAAECAGTVTTTDSVIGFSGCISGEVADIFISAMDAKYRLVLLQSSGGDVSAAIRMAQVIAERELPVVVRGICLSSCANYLMPAGTSISVERNAIIAFHGDARLTIRRMEGTDAEQREAVLLLSQMLQEEEAWSRKVARAALVHELQAVASAPIGSKVRIKRAGSDLMCSGQGLLPWFPSLEMLQDLNVIDQVVEFDESLLPQVRVVTYEGLPSVHLNSQSPLSGCLPP